jgi:hypothetical protein
MRRLEIANGWNRSDAEGTNRCKTAKKELDQGGVTKTDSTASVCKEVRHRKGREQVLQEFGRGLGGVEEEKEDDDATIDDRDKTDDENEEGMLSLHDYWFKKGGGRKKQECGEETEIRAQVGHSGSRGGNGNGNGNITDGILKELKVANNKGMEDSSGNDSNKSRIKENESNVSSNVDSGDTNNGRGNSSNARSATTTSKRDSGQDDIKESEEAKGDDRDKDRHVKNNNKEQEEFGKNQDADGSNGQVGNASTAKRCTRVLSNDNGATENDGIFAKATKGTGPNVNKNGKTLMENDGGTNGEVGDKESSGNNDIKGITNASNTREGAKVNNTNASSVRGASGESNDQNDNEVARDIRMKGGNQESNNKNTRNKIGSENKSKMGKDSSGTSNDEKQDVLGRNHDEPAKIQGADGSKEQVGNASTAKRCTRVLSNGNGATENDGIFAKATKGIGPNVNKNGKTLMENDECANGELGEQETASNIKLGSPHEPTKEPTKVQHVGKDGGYKRKGCTTENERDANVRIGVLRLRGGGEEMRDKWQRRVEQHDSLRISKGKSMEERKEALEAATRDSAAQSRQVQDEGDTPMECTENDRAKGTGNNSNDSNNNDKERSKNGGGQGGGMNAGRGTGGRGWTGGRSGSGGNGGQARSGGRSNGQPNLSELYKGSGDAIQKQQTGRASTTIRVEFIKKEDVPPCKYSKELPELMMKFWIADAGAVFKSLLPDQGSIRQAAEFPANEVDGRNFFKIATSYSGNEAKTTVVFILESRFTLDQLKQDSRLFQYLRDQNIHIFKHAHSTITVQAIGWIASKSPWLTDRDQAVIDVGDALAEYIITKDKKQGKMTTPNEARRRLPTMEIGETKVLHAVKDCHGNKSEVLRTRALELKCETSRSNELRQIMIEATTEGAVDTRRLGIFVPYRAKADTIAYREMIHSQICYLDQLAVIPIWGLHPDVLGNKTRCQQTGEDSTLLERLLDATHEASESEGSRVTSYSLGNIEKTRQTDTHGKWFVVTTKSAKIATCMLLDQVLIGEGNMTPEHQGHAARGAPYAQGIRRPVTQNDNIAVYSNYLGVAATMTGRQLILDTNFRIRDNSLRLSDIGPHQRSRPLEMLVAPLTNKWLDSQRGGALNGTINASRLEESMNMSNDNSAWQSVQTKLTDDIANLQEQINAQAAEKTALLEARAAEKNDLENTMRLQAARQAERLVQTTKNHNAKMAELVKGFDEYKVEQASSQVAMQKILMATNARLEKLMDLMMARPVNTTEHRSPEQRISNRPRVSLEAQSYEEPTILTTITAAPATSALTNTSNETGEERKRAGKRHKDRHSPKKQMAPVPVSDAHLDDTGMESVEQPAAKTTSPSLLPRIIQAAANSMSAVLEPASLLAGILEAAARTEAKENQSSLARAANLLEAPVSGPGDNNNDDDSLNTVFDTTPPAKGTEKSTDASLSDIASESIEEVYSDEPNASGTIRNISTIGNTDISTIAQDIESDSGWSDGNSESSMGGSGMRQRKGKEDNRLASDISNQHYQDDSDYDYDCDPSQQLTQQNEMENSDEEDLKPAEQIPLDMDSSFEDKSTKIAMEYSGTTVGNSSTNHQEALRRAKGMRKPQDNV